MIFRNAVIDGPESLQEQGIADEALLEVAETNCDVLSFVHIVEEKETEKENYVPDCSNSPALLNAQKAESEEDSGEYESSSEEEF